MAMIDDTARQVETVSTTESGMPEPEAPEIKPFVEVREDGEIVYNMHVAQSRMIASRKKRVVFVAGTRSGKTASAPVWLIEEMRDCGPGNYLVVAPSYPLLYRGAYLEMNKLFVVLLKLGQFKQNPWRFVFNEYGENWLYAGTRYANIKHRPPTEIFLVHASDPNALEALTAKACWADEAGQQEFKLESYEAIERRLSIDQGRMLISTTPYDLGWLYSRLVRPWEQARANGGDHPHIDVIKARSIDNPAFPMDEYLRQKELMPFWRWDMMYNGNFTLPSGLVYDILPDIESQIRLPRCPLPQHWPRYLGLDFGGINTYGIFGAQATEEWQHPFTGQKVPRGGIVFYREYYPARAMPIIKHAQNIEAIEPYIERAVGGARSEDQWRDEFTEGGLYVERPRVHDLSVGIARTYGLFARGLYFAFDDLDTFWSHLMSYRYEVDPATGEVLPELKIVDQNKYHGADGVRYFSSMVMEIIEELGVAVAGGESHEGGFFDELQGKGSARTAEGIRVVKDTSHELENTPGVLVSKARGRRRMQGINPFGRMLPGGYQELRDRGLL